MAFAVDNKKIAKNTVALYVRTIITMAISFYTARVTLQVLGVDDYGLNNLVGSVVALFSFLNASMGTAVQRYFNVEIGKGHDSALGKVFGVGLYLHIIVALITVIIAEIFAVFFLDRLNIPQERLFAAHVVFQISVFSMALTIVNVPNYALLKAREKFTTMAKIEVIQALLRLLVLYFLCIINFDKLIIFSIFNLGVTLYYILSLLFMARKFAESHYGPCRDKALISEMLKFISLLIITVLAEYARNQGMIMIINLFFGLAINAAYAIAIQISNMINSFVINIKQPIIPQMMSSYGAGDKKAMFNLIYLGTKITAIMMLAITLPVIFEMDFLLTLWLKEPPHHTSFLAILVLVNINIASFTYFLYQGVHATGNITKQQSWMSVLFLLNIFLVYLAFRLGFSFYCALYVTIVISFIQCFVNVIMAKQYLGLNISNFVLKCSFPTFVVTVISFFAIWMICYYIPDGFFRVIVVFVAGIGVIMLLSYMLVLNSEEKEKMFAMIRMRCSISVFNREKV